jgi:GNAT superfamily N-acetyltransferase
MRGAGMKKMASRPARPGEAALLSGLAFRSKAYWGYSDEFMAACRNELTYSEKQIDAPQFSFFVCLVDNKIVGFHALERIGSDVAELEALFVSPEYIGCGFGRALIEHAIEFAHRLGASSLVIQGDPHAEQFYLAVGARRSGTRESCSIAASQLPLFSIDLNPQIKREGSLPCQKSVGTNFKK